MPRIAINPDILAWALRDSGRTLDDVEIATNRPREEIERWFARSSEPYLGDLRKVGALLGRSPYFFALPKPPKSRTYAGRFRTAIDAQVGPDERALEIDALRWAQRHQDLCKSLLTADDFNVPFSTEGEAADVAERARTWLAWDTSIQVRATSKTASFRALRAAIEQRQIVVTLTSAHTSRFCGFSLPDSLLPLIYVNKDYDLASVRSFTLLHELAHVLRSQRRVCYGGDVGAERWCNQFATAFLMPAEEVATYFRNRRLAFSSNADTEPVRLVANRYKTSWHSAAIRLEELHLAPSGIADYVKQNRPEPKDTGFNPEGGKRTPALRVDEYGGTLLRIVSAGLDSGKYHSLDARRLLRVNGPQLDEIRRIAESESG